MMNNNYPLEWLDALILVHLNPNKTDLCRLSEAELAVISEHVVKESGRIQVRIKNEIFVLRRKRQIRLLVRKYHSTLIFLLDTMVENYKCSVFQQPLLAVSAELVIKCLDDLLSFLEKRFSGYLSLDERVPATYLLVSRKELQLKLKKLLKMKMENEEKKQVLNTVLAELEGGFSMQERDRKTFRQMLYERNLLNELEQMNNLEDQGLFFMLDHTLIGLNFNSPVYINLLTKRLACKVEMEEDLAGKLNLLSYYWKEFNQMHCSEKLFFKAEAQHLKTSLGNWFVHEMRHLEKQLEIAAVSSKDAAGEEKTQNKLQCDLSADQIGIILRAADEARVVKSRSMSLVFQRIVPYLSTSFKRDLSYQSVRSKSYNAEENDKNIAIMTLEKMIKKIRSY
ncbi:hypothetical protein [Flavobacterium johnsoniae]|uniref:Uncharacterized protein n=1 Tax=Flavobacterium johnsoniae TaxID=986 RepID=A0A1J7BNW4_FLAJO|nr:hypothetical protein [Flavobacterium johnsoniae]OIV40379.1 hypothetical protein BKM63_20610 [Flavobacterium johnsoniae]